MIIDRKCDCGSFLIKDENMLYFCQVCGNLYKLKENKLIQIKEIEKVQKIEETNEYITKLSFLITYLYKTTKEPDWSKLENTEQRDIFFHIGRLKRYIEKIEKNYEKYRSLFFEKIMKDK